MASFALNPRTAASKEGSLTSKIRVYIAEHLGVDVETVRNDTHLRDDLGLDLMDILELTILVEEQFANERAGGETEEIEVVGDLICYIESGMVQAVVPSGRHATKYDPPARHNRSGPSCRRDGGE